MVTVIGVVCCWTIELGDSLVMPRIVRSHQTGPTLHDTGIYYPDCSASSTRPRRTFLFLTDDTTGKDNEETPEKESSVRCSLQGRLQLMGLLSSIAWIAISAKVLSFHPDAQFADCTLQHNILTMTQAWCFPLSVLGAASSLSDFEVLSPLVNGGLSIAASWLVASTLVPNVFCFGYDLIPKGLKVLGGAVFASLALLSATTLCVQGKSPFDGNTIQKSPRRIPTQGTPLTRTTMFTALGMMALSLIPLFSNYPMATIPSILGKRLSRPASAFYFLASTLLFDLARIVSSPKQETLRIQRYRFVARCLQWGSGLHVGLVLLKLAGIDDGGYLFPGTGLWQWYPAMLQVPVALGTSLGVHCLNVLVCRSVLGQLTQPGDVRAT